MSEKDDLKYKPDWNWAGRSLENYIALHPKARGAKTLTEARIMAFGPKPKRFSCRCGQPKCARSGAGSKASHC